jgi:flagellar basal-body rod protein FlgB
MKILDTMFDRTVTGHGKTMDLTWHRNQAITANIANAETPMYRAVDVTFGKELDRAFGETFEVTKRTDPKHLEVSFEQSSHTVGDESGATKPDGNNVDIDLQMGRLTQNSGEYMNAARLIKRQLGLIRTAIRTGER